MNERPTPETDAAWQSDKDTIFRVMTSRRLERERDEAREHLSASNHFLEKYIAERDEARERAAEWAAQLLAEIEGDE